MAKLSALAQANSVHAYKEILTLFSSARFRAVVNKSCPSIVEWQSERILDRLNDEFAVMELIHRCLAQGIRFLGGMLHKFCSILRLTIGHCKNTVLMDRTMIWANKMCVLCMRFEMCMRLIIFRQVSSTVGSLSTLTQVLQGLVNLSFFPNLVHRYVLLSCRCLQTFVSIHIYKYELTVICSPLRLGLLQWQMQFPETLALALTLTLTLTLKS